MNLPYRGNADTKEDKGIKCGKHIGACPECKFTLLAETDEKCPRCETPIKKETK